MQLYIIIYNFIFDDINNIIYKYGYFSLEETIKEIIFKNYRIGYNVSSDSNIIYIRFVIHSKRDLSNFFSKFYS